MAGGDSLPDNQRTELLSSPGFLDVSGMSLLDSSNTSVCPSVSSSAVLTPTALSASGPEDMGSSSSSHERGGE